MKYDAKLRIVFIVGSQRSGTTYLASLIGRYPGFLSTPEAQFIELIASYPDEPMNDIDALALSERLLRNFRYWTLDLQLSPTEILSYARGATPEQFLTSLLRRYQAKVGAKGLKAWVEHSPEHYRILPILLERFPSAKFIHLVRDGRGVFQSFLRLGWGASTPKGVARAWQTAVLTSVAYEARYPDRIRTFRYEDLITNHMETLEGIADFLEIPRDMRTMGETTLILPRFTRKQHRFVLDEPRIDVLNSWKDNLSPKQVRTFNYFALSTLFLLGYEGSGAERTRPALLTIFLGEIRDLIKISMSTLSIVVRERVMVWIGRRRVARLR